MPRRTPAIPVIRVPTRCSRSRGYAQNKDVFHGKAGATNILWMANGKEALFLDDGFSPGTDSLRLTNIGEIRCGTGDQIVDLTSPRFTIGDITIGGGTGNDVMMSSIGNDTIIAGKGNDYMWGGSGDDMFQWEASTAGAFADTIIGAQCRLEVLGDALDEFLAHHLGGISVAHISGAHATTALSK